MASFTERLAHAWNVFKSNEQDQSKPRPYTEYYGASYGRRPDRPFMLMSNERSIVSSIYLRVAVDVASVDIRHVRTDDDGRYVEDIKSGLQNCFQVEANLDQAARMFRQDVISTLIDKGSCAIVPIDTTINPETSGGFDILSLRVGEIMTWFPGHVRVSVYNEKRGLREEVVIAKTACAIIENPLYGVMNEPNSTLQRLIAKLNMLDVIDKQSASGKMDLIIQLPYVIKSEARRDQAEKRRKDIEFQLKDSQYGIAYTDGTEKITQLNRPAENNLMQQVEVLTKMLYGQLGLTEEIMNGTAGEEELLNYWNRTIEPLLTAIVEEMRRKFLTKTARSQKQTILFFRDAFKLVPLGGEHGLASVFDIMARNEIMASNELRQVIGLKPSNEPRADQLINSNMPQPNTVDSTAEEVDQQALLDEFGGSNEDA